MVVPPNWRWPGGGGSGGANFAIESYGSLFPLVANPESYYYDFGYREGNGDGYRLGYDEAYLPAYEAVYDGAYESGVPIGRSEGVTEGLADGEAHGLTDGRYDGAVAGELLGFRHGYERTYRAMSLAGRSGSAYGLSYSVYVPQLVGRHAPIIAPNYGLIPEPTSLLMAGCALAVVSPRRR